MPEISLVETRKIIQVIRNKYQLDFSQYSLPSFRLALDRSIVLHHFRYPELLTTRLLEVPDFFPEFLHEISVSAMELFRDTDTWSVMKTSILPGYLSKNRSLSIWFPLCDNAQDLFSLLILLYIEFPYLKPEILVSSLSDHTLNMVASGEISIKEKENGYENFIRLFPEGNFDGFLKQNGNRIRLDKELMRNVTFRKHDSLFNPGPEKTDMILFRNCLLKYNKDHYFEILNSLLSKLVTGGVFITGVKENISFFIEKTKSLEYISIHEKIYRKIKK